MELDKKRLRIITNHEYVLKELVLWYNQVYKTDFLFIEYIEDEVNFVILEYSKASENEIFDLGRIFGNEQIKRGLTNNKTAR